MKPCLNTRFVHFVAPTRLYVVLFDAAGAHRNDLGLVAEAGDALEERLPAHAEVDQEREYGKWIVA